MRDGTWCEFDQNEGGVGEVMLFTTGEIWEKNRCSVKLPSALHFHARFYPSDPGMMLVSSTGGELEQSVTNTLINPERGTLNAEP
jgi:hypothetical protein